MAIDHNILAGILHKEAEGMPLDAADLAALSEARHRWPYAAVADILTLLHGADNLPPQERSDLRRRVALAVDDPRTIDVLRGAGWAGFYPEPPAEEGRGADTATDDAIALFLNTYGHQSPEEDALLERMIFNPTPDYAEVLAREEQENLPDEPADPDSPEGRIDAFILSRHPAAAPEPKPEPVPKESRTPVHRPARDAGMDSGSLSESLAAAYVRQRRYRQAYDLLSELSEKYPHRNIFIQPQLAFLRKLIKNESAK